jgi:hypothetical protein
MRIQQKTHNKMGTTKTRQQRYETRTSETLPSSAESQKLYKIKKQKKPTHKV